MSYIWVHKEKVRKKTIESFKIPFGKLTKEQLALIAFRKDHESGKATEVYLLWHSVVTAISFAFFIGLFSLGNSYRESCLLLIASIFFAVSLTMNSSFCIFYQLSNRLTSGDGNLLFKIHLVRKFEIVRTTAMVSPLIGTIFLILYYSVLALIICLIAFGITAFIINKTLSTYVLEIDNKIHEERLEAIEKDDFEKQDLLDRLYGK
ncbi:hypothetical protein [Pantoea dispersa]|uniref:hypothetical protein n=1 Tax=Pantoea dispersa TaxID=59814 RepID=UPI000A52FC88|nr:hypothetical protein [Pantoea dispersa]